MTRQTALKLVHTAASLSGLTAAIAPDRSVDLLRRVLADGVLHGDAEKLLDQLPLKSVDLFFTSPPYADARAYSRIHPNRYVEWFLPFARSMYEATKPSGSLIINIKNRVANKGPLKGQRHPYVYQLVLALQNIGWRWIETYIWAKPNGVPGRFGPRTKDAFEYVYHLPEGLSLISISTLSGCPIRQTRPRLRGVNETRRAAAVPKQASVAIGPKPTCWAVPIPGMS
jgi:hypothetical protein